MQEIQVWSLGQDDRKWQPTPVSLPQKSHGQRCLVGYNPRCCKESDTTKQHECRGEGVSVVYTSQGDTSLRYTHPPLSEPCGDGSHFPLGAGSSVCLAGTCRGTSKVKEECGTMPLSVWNMGPQDRWVFADEASCPCAGGTILLMSRLRSPMLPVPWMSWHMG